ncbi:glycosyltransferase family 39 protein, partial [bacterium]|nr:glycosyltransferase family 39 protein [bacterium]
MLLLLLISQRRRLMTLGGLIWAFWAFSLYYSVRPLHLFVSWPWNSTPVWRLDLHGRWAGFPWEIVGVGTLLILTTGCAAVLGERLGRLLFPDNGRMGRVIWGSGLVFAILGYVAFGLGVVGGLGSAQWVFGLLLVLGVALALFSIGTDFRRKPRPEAMRSGEGSALSRPEWILILALAIVQFLAMLYALTPSVQSDALRYHLAAPQEWLKAGRITYLPYEAFSNFPFLVEMLFLYGLGLGSDLLAKGMHFVFLPLSTGAVALIAHEIAGAYRLRGIRSGVLAALAWGTLPLTIPLAGWAFIDLTVAFFTLAMVYFLIRWARSGHARHWIAAAVFGGLLCASKYTGVVFVMWGALLMGVWGLRMDGFRRIGLWLGRAALFGLIAAALASPWWIKNVIYTGNPVYPLAWSVFDGGE